MIRILSGRVHVTCEFLDKHVVPLVVEPDEMKNPRMEIGEGAITLKGDYQTGIMPIGIQVEFKPSAEEGKLIANLGSVRLVTGFNAPAMVRQLLVDQMEVRVQEMPGARMDGERIEIDLTAFAQGHNVDVSGRLEAVDVHAGHIECVFGPGPVS
jgi:hypothetical protein